MSKTIKRLDLLFREVQDSVAQENFYRIKAYMDNLASTGLVGPPGIFGGVADFEDFSDLATFTTTAATNQVAATFTSTSKQAGKYRVAIQWDWSYSSTTNDAIFSVWVDGVQVSQEFRYELSNVATQLLNNHWFYYPTFATVQTHTIELRCRAEIAGSTVTVTQVRAEMWRVS